MLPYHSSHCFTLYALCPVFCPAAGVDPVFIMVGGLPWFARPAGIVPVFMAGGLPCFALLLVLIQSI